MPTIPGILQPASMDVLNPSVPVPAGTEVSAATERLGGTVAQASFAILDKVKQAEAVDASSQAFFGDRYASEDYITQLKLKYPEGYVTDANGQRVQNSDKSYRTITQDYRDWANQRFVDNQNAMPTDLAKARYNALAGDYYNTSLIKVRGDELKLRTESFANNQADKLQFGTSRLVDAPDVNQAYQLVDGLTVDQKSQEGSLLSTDQVHDNITKIRAKAADDLFLGMFNQVLAEPKKGESRNGKIDYALSVLQGQDPDSQRRAKSGLKTISDMMNPEQKAKAEAELLRLRQTADKLDTSDWHARMRTASAQIDIETRNPGNTSMRQAIPFAPLYQQGYELYKAGKMSDFEFTQAIGDLVAKDAGRAIFTSPSFLLAPPEQKQQFIDQAVKLANGNFQKYMSPELQQKTPYISAQLNKEIIHNLQTIAQATDQTAHTDFVDFGQFHPDVKRETAQLAASQAFTSPQTLWKTGGLLKQRNSTLQSLGDTYFGAKSPDFRLISKEESGQLSGFIKSDLTNYSQAADGLVALHNADPAHYASIIDQMVRDKNLSADWRLATVVPGRQATEDLVKTIKNGELIRENAIKQIQGLGKVKPEDFEVGVSTYAGPYLTAMVQSNQDSAVAENEVKIMRNVVVTKAMDLYRQEQGARTVQDYVKDATDTFFGQRFKAVQNGNTLWGRMTGQDSSLRPSYYMLPKVLNGRPLSDQELATGQFNGKLILQSETLKKYGAVPPKGLPPELADQYFQKVQQNGRFVNAGDGQNLRVEWYDQQNSTYVPVFTAKKDRNGLPVPLTIPISRVITPIQKPAKSMVPQPTPSPSGTPQKGFWQNFLEKAGEMGAKYTNGL